jgi:hypothetical protein
MRNSDRANQKNLLTLRNRFRSAGQPKIGT